jgi:hypothetical protein
MSEPSPQQPKYAEGLVSQEAVLHVFAKATGDNQRGYMLNVADGIMQLQRLSLERYKPMTYAESLELYSGDLAPTREKLEPREAVMLASRMERLVLGKMGIAR